MTSRAVYIETFGCQMNEHDSETMRALLAPLHYLPVDDPCRADLIIVNSCSVRKKPEHKFYSVLGRMKRLRQAGKVLLAAAGCVAQQEGKHLLDKAPYVDLIIGPRALSRLPELVEAALSTGKKQIAVEVCDDFPCPDQRPSAEGRKVKAYVTIMQGCDNFCSFCVVPSVRGREKSRSSEEVLCEITRLVESGVQEVMLLGQNVNSYGLTSPGALNFPRLLGEINRISGLKRIRFTTSHPKDLSEELIECFGSLDKLCPHIHLPVQSGSTRVLARMNRGYTREEYLAKVRRLRQVRPEIALTTDIIVGFPGETEEDFQDTLDIVREIKYDEFYSFKYSDRPHTAASEYDQKLPEEEKARRLSLLHSTQKSITVGKNKALVGKSLEVLVEGCSKKGARQLAGRTGTNKVVNFEGPPDLVGEMVMITIIAANPHSLHGCRAL